MRIKTLVAGAVACLFVAVVAVSLSCQADGPTATPEAEVEEGTDANVGIWGYVLDADTLEGIADADVDWWDESTGMIGSDAVDDIGRYDIDPGDEYDWSDHDGHNLRGEASHPAYHSQQNTITNFQSSNIPYKRDFYLSVGK